MSFVKKLRRNSQLLPTATDVSKEEEAGVTSSPVFNHFIRPCLAEFLGTGFYVFFSDLCLPITKDEQPILSTIVVALTQGVSLMALTLLFGHISGGHFNPALTLAAWIGSGIRFVLAAFYFVIQIFGAFIGGLLVRGVLNRESFIARQGGVTLVNKDQATKGKVGYFASTKPTRKLAWLQAILLELIVTFFLVLGYLLVAVDGEGPTLTATAGVVGAVITVGSLSAYPLTAASFNPAKSLAAAASLGIFGDEGQWEYHYVYWVAPFIGAVIAAFTYTVLLARDSNRWVFKR